MCNHPAQRKVSSIFLKLIWLNSVESHKIILLATVISVTFLIKKNISYTTHWWDDVKNIYDNKNSIHFKLRQSKYIFNQYYLFVLIFLFTCSLHFSDITVCGCYPVLYFSFISHLTKAQESRTKLLICKYQLQDGSSRLCLNKRKIAVALVECLNI